MGTTLIRITLLGTFHFLSSLQLPTPLFLFSGGKSHSFLKMQNLPFSFSFPSSILHIYSSSKGLYSLATNTIFESCVFNFDSPIFLLYIYHLDKDVLCSTHILVSLLISCQSSEGYHESQGPCTYSRYVLLLHVSQSMPTPFRASWLQTLISPVKGEGRAGCGHAASCLATSQAFLVQLGHNWDRASNKDSDSALMSPTHFQLAVASKESVAISLALRIKRLPRGCMKLLGKQRTVPGSLHLFVATSR